jgi:hypothetical protein
VFKAIIEESVVPVQVGSPITIAFSHSIEIGVHKQSGLYTLERKEDEVTITTKRKLPDSGVPLVVKLQDSSVFLVRLVNASKRTPAESRVFIGDPGVCGGVWYDQDAW